MLDNMIKREESNVNFTGASVLEDEVDTDGNVVNVESEPAELKPYEAEYEEGIPNTHKLKANSSKKLTDQNEFNEAKDALATGMQLSVGQNKLLQTAQTLIIDERYVDKIVEYGYPRENILRYLNNNDLNSATTAYYLLSHPDQQTEPGDMSTEMTQDRLQKLHGK